LLYLKSIVKELASAQQRTETKLQQLIDEHKDTRKQVGGLATTVGYRFWLTKVCRLC
jgi:hypothetical protein